MTFLQGGPKFEDNYATGCSPHPPGSVARSRTHKYVGNRWLPITAVDRSPDCPVCLTAVTLYHCAYLPRDPMQSAVMRQYVCGGFWLGSSLLSDLVSMQFLL